MSLFSPDVLPALNLKNHIFFNYLWSHSSLKNLMLSGCDENRLDYSLYKLEQVVYLCLQSKYLARFRIWRRYSSVTDSAWQPFKENTENNSHLTSSRQTTYTGSTGRPAFSIPSVTLKLYLSYGFPFKRLLICLVLEAKSLVDVLNHKTVREEVPKYDNPWTLLSLLYYTTSLTVVSEEWKDFCLGEVLKYNGVVWGHLLENRSQWDSATNFPFQYC